MLRYYIYQNKTVLYDIDIAARKLADQHGARLERSESLNASPAFISALADIVSAHLPVQIPND